MKNIVGVLILFFTISLLSCADSACVNTDQYNFAINYYHTLESNYKGEGALVGEGLRANLVLANLTGIESKASYGDITVYSNNIDFLQDMKKWKKWIKDESCKVDLKLMKKREVEIISQTDWIEK